MVGGAISVYKATKSGRPAAALTRRLKTEEAIYHQFIHKLLAPNVAEDEIQKLLNQDSPDLQRWKDDSLNKKIRERLGNKRADIILESLEEMEKILRSLNAELSNISRGIVRTTTNSCKTPVSYANSFKGGTRQSTVQTSGHKIQLASI